MQHECSMIVYLQNCQSVSSMKAALTCSILSVYMLVMQQNMIQSVIVVDFQLHLQYGCSIYCGAASAANMLQFRGTECSMNAVEMQ